MKQSSNPFQASMSKLLIPAHMGTCISLRGFTLEADADGCVEVPTEAVAELMAHGLEKPPAPAAHPTKK